jgi:hypothetical protein
MQPAGDGKVLVGQRATDPVGVGTSWSTPARDWWLRRRMPTIRGVRMRVWLRLVLNAAGADSFLRRCVGPEQVWHITLVASVEQTDARNRRRRTARKNGKIRAQNLDCDTQGNVFTWCQERFGEYQIKSSGISEGKEDMVLVVKGTDGRVLRGGSFVNPASIVRSANRNYDVPANRIYISGFRLARTLPLSTFTALPPTAEGGRKMKTAK